MGNIGDMWGGPDLTVADESTLADLDPVGELAGMFRCELPTWRRGAFPAPSWRIRTS